MSAPKKANDPKAWLDELKGNRRTQVALLGLVAVGGFMAYTLLDSGPAPRKTRTPAGVVTGGLSDTQVQQLRPLRHLATLGRAGQLPGEDRMYRDLFTFDMPPPQPEPVKPVRYEPPPPPREKTQEEIDRDNLEAAMATEERQKPSDLRYIGYFGNERRGRFGAFMKGEEPRSLKVGELANPAWRLVEVTKEAAVFQNLKFESLKHRANLTEASGGPGGGRPVNEF